MSEKEKLRKKFQETKKALNKANKILGVNKKVDRSVLDKKLRGTKKTLNKVNKILGVGEKEQFNSSLRDQLQSYLETKGWDFSKPAKLDEQEILKRAGELSYKEGMQNQLKQYLNKKGWNFPIDKPEPIRSDELINRPTSGLPSAPGGMVGMANALAQAYMGSTPSNKEEYIEPTPSDKEKYIEPTPSDKEKYIKPKPSDEEEYIEPKPSDEEEYIEPTSRLPSMPGGMVGMANALAQAQYGATPQQPVIIPEPPIVLEEEPAVAPASPKESEPQKELHKIENVRNYLNRTKSSEEENTKKTENIKDYLNRTAYPAYEAETINAMNRVRETLGFPKLTSKEKENIKDYLSRLEKGVASSVIEKKPMVASIGASGTSGEIQPGGAGSLNSLETAGVLAPVAPVAPVAPAPTPTPVAPVAPAAPAPTPTPVAPAPTPTPVAQPKPTVVPKTVETFASTAAERRKTQQTQEEIARRSMELAGKSMTSPKSYIKFSDDSVAYPYYEKPIAPPTPPKEFSLVDLPQDQQRILEDMVENKEPEDKISAKQKQFLQEMQAKANKEYDEQVENYNWEMAHQDEINKVLQSEKMFFINKQNIEREQALLKGTDLSIGELSGMASDKRAKEELRLIAGPAINATEQFVEEMKETRDKIKAGIRAPNIPDASKIMMIIGAGLTAWGSAMTGRGDPNAGVNLINQVINQDIARQEKNLALAGKSLEERRALLLKHRANLFASVGQKIKVLETMADTENKKEQLRFLKLKSADMYLDTARKATEANAKMQMMKNKKSYMFFEAKYGKQAGEAPANYANQAYNLSKLEAQVRNIKNKREEWKNILGTNKGPEKVDEILSKVYTKVSETNMIGPWIKALIDPSAEGAQNKPQSDYLKGLIKTATGLTDLQLKYLLDMETMYSHLVVDYGQYKSGADIPEATLKRFTNMLPSVGDQTYVSKVKLNNLADALVAGWVGLGHGLASSGGTYASITGNYLRNAMHLTKKFELSNKPYDILHGTSKEIYDTITMP